MGALAHGRRYVSSTLVSVKHEESYYRPTSPHVPPHTSGEVQRVTPGRKTSPHVPQHGGGRHLVSQNGKALYPSTRSVNTPSSVCSIRCPRMRSRSANSNEIANVVRRGNLNRDAVGAWRAGGMAEEDLEDKRLVDRWSSRRNHTRDNEGTA
ncbi:hypothetical protein BKA93DRAFT_340090 [Sparassis latifolia]